MTPEQEQKLNDLYDFVQSLKAASSIPMEVDAAFRTRLADIVSFRVGAKGADTEDVSINEAGAASHVVLNDPDVFVRIVIGGTNYDVPAFTS